MKREERMSRHSEPLKFPNQSGFVLHNYENFELRGNCEVLVWMDGDNDAEMFLIEINMENIQAVRRQRGKQRSKQSANKFYANSSPWEP